MMTELVLVFLATLAVVTSTAGLFVNFDDHWTGVLVIFLGAVLWGVVAISSYSVIVPDGSGASQPIMPMAVLGFGMSALVGLYGLYELLTGASTEASEANIELAP